MASLHQKTVQGDNMKQKTLTGETVEPKLIYQWKTKRKLDTVYEQCPNCYREVKFDIFEEAEEFDAKTGKPQWDMGVFVHGEAECKCGASLLIADDMESVKIYWLNKREMCFGEKQTK